MPRHFFRALAQTNTQKNCGEERRTRRRQLIRVSGVEMSRKTMTSVRKCAYLRFSLNETKKKKMGLKETIQFTHQ